MRFSIVTISLNQSRYLEQTIRSVLNQDYEDVEYIVVDPGSTDGSRAIIERYRDRIDKILYDPDNGPADGLNKGFAHATGDICAYLNADDFLLPGSIAWAHRYFRSNPGISVLIGAIKMANRSGRLAWRGRVADSVELARFVSHSIYYYQQGTFFRKSQFDEVGGFNPANRTCWDLELAIDMALHGAQIRPIAKPLAVFRVHGESISGKGENRLIYEADRERIRRKVIMSGVPVGPEWQTMLYKMEHRLNPLRFVKQLHPA